MVDNMKMKPAGGAAGWAGSAWVWGVAVMVVCAALYYPSLTGGFVHTDRAMVFKPAGQAGGDVYAGGAGAGEGGGFEWTPQRPPGALLAYSLAKKALGEDFFGFHVFQVCWQALAVAMMFFMMFKCGFGAGSGGRVFFPPVAGALLLAAHPVAGAAACWISALKDVIAAAFLLCSAGLYFSDSAREEQSVTVGYAVSVLLYMLACMTDGRSVLWPLVYMVANRFSGGGSGLKERGGRALKLAPYFAVSIVGFFLFLRSGGYGLPGSSARFDIAAALCSAGEYVKDTVFPAGLGPVLIQGGRGGGVLMIAIGAVAVFGAPLFVVIAMAAKKFRLSCVAAAWLWAALLPQVFEAGEYMTDHRSYMLAGAVVFGFSVLLRRVFLSSGLAGRGGAAMCAGAVLAALLFLGAGFRAQVGYFSSGKAFWTRALEDYPREAEAWYLKGVAEVADELNFTEAEKSFKEAIRLAPERDDFVVFLSLIYVKYGKFAKAVDLLADARAARPKSAALFNAVVDAQYKWGLSLLREGKPLECHEHFIIAARMRPENEYFHSALAASYFRQERYQEAYAEMAIAVKLAPGNADFKKGMDRVLKEAESKGISIIKEGVTDDFFNKLKEAGN